MFLNKLRDIVEIKHPDFRLRLYVFGGSRFI